MEETNHAAQVVGPYRLGGLLGKGAMATVRIGQRLDSEGRLSNSRQVAIKIISKQKLTSHREQISMTREITVMKLLRHPNILRLHDLYENDKKIFLVVDYWPGGDLARHIVLNGPLKLSDAALLFRQLIDAIEFCHQNHITHRDLKPENLLLSEDAKTLVLSDFGLSTGTQGSDRFLTTRCGSPHYVSPEIARGMPYIGSKSDIWSCGVVLYVMVTATLPFDGESPLAILKNIVKGKFLMPQNLPIQLQTLIIDMMAIDPLDRLSIPQIRSSTWMVASKVNVTVPVPHHRPTKMAAFAPQDLEDNKKLLDDLQLLGWEKDQLETLLLSPDDNEAKTFYSLLKGQSQRKDELPQGLRRRSLSAPMGNPALMSARRADDFVKTRGPSPSNPALSVTRLRIIEEEKPVKKEIKVIITPEQKVKTTKVLAKTPKRARTRESRDNPKSGPYYDKALNEEQDFFEIYVHLKKVFSDIETQGAPDPKKKKSLVNNIFPAKKDTKKLLEADVDLREKIVRQRRRLAKAKKSDARNQTS